MVSKVMDYMISPVPIRIIDPHVERSMLRIGGIRVGQTGHLPGRTLFRREAVFDTWAAVFIVSGAGTYREDGGGEQAVRGGSLFFFHPGRTYDFGPEAGGSWDEYYINFEGDRSEEWLENGLIFAGKVLPGAVGEEVPAMCEEVLACMERGLPGEADRAALLLERLLLECALTAAGKDRLPEDDLMSRVRKDLEASVYGGLHPETIAERHHVSVSTLRRAVRRASGYPLYEYVHRLKMAEARHLLLNTPLRIQEIAAALGYADPFYFSRLFKKYSGKSPTACREQIYQS